MPWETNGPTLGNVQVANAILRGGAGDGAVVTALERGRAGAAYTFVPSHDPSTGFTYRYSDEVVDHPSYGRLAVLVPTGERWGYSPSRSRSPQPDTSNSVDDLGAAPAPGRLSWHRKLVRLWRGVTRRI
jgi:hypothetical protein